MDAVVKRTRVVVSTVGPFALYGTALVEACAKNGVDYVDITGARARGRRTARARPACARA